MFYVPQKIGNQYYWRHSSMQILKKWKGVVQ
jgi:hypothetical protein